MYEKHFRLSRRPFRALAQGETVFVGHQVSALTAEMNKALSAADAVIAVSAPVGGGKSTAVRHALHSMGDTVNIVHIDRLIRQSDEIHESSLEQLGVDKVPPGTVQRVSLLRKKLADQEKNDVRTVFVVEDVSRAGADTLCDLEALTAADTGACGVAAIVVMGDSGLDELLSAAPLARLNQRLRLRYNLEPFSRQELLNYLQHWMKLAGADLDDIFEPDSLSELFSVSRGLPRLANRIADAAMTQAAERGLATVTAELIEQAAACEPCSLGDADRLAALQNTAVRDSGAHGVGEEPDSSELTADTRIEVQGSGQSEPQPGVVSERREESSVNSTGSAASLPEWDREPTLAQLRPDIEALEKAMAVDKPGDGASDAEPEIPVLTENSEESFIATTTEAMPEITLDREIQATIEEATEDIKRAEAEAAAKAAANAEAEKTINLASTGELTPETLRAASRDDNSASAPADAATAAAGQSGASGQQDTNRTASVADKSTDDDGYMGDSAFGAVFNDIADEPPANENMELGVAELVEPCEADGEPNDPGITAGTPASPRPGLDEEASKRLATVRALNGLPDTAPGGSPNAEFDLQGENGGASQELESDEDDIDTIEVQIGTSMTQTFKALDADDDEDEDHASRFAFSRRFRKS
jgi:type II secretory pathway predicted ATPase ExeA